MTSQRDSLFAAARETSAQGARAVLRRPRRRRDPCGERRLYRGCNVENAAYPLGNCAEASAIAAGVEAEGEEFRIAETAVWATGPDGTAARGLALRRMPPAHPRIRRGRHGDGAFSRPRAARSARRRSTNSCHTPSRCRPRAAAYEPESAPAGRARPHATRNGRHGGRHPAFLRGCRRRRRTTRGGLRISALRSVARARLDAAGAPEIAVAAVANFPDGGNDAARPLQRDPLWRSPRAPPNSISSFRGVAWLAGDRDAAARGSSPACRAAERRQLLKVILETGELGEAGLIREMSRPSRSTPAPISSRPRPAGPRPARRRQPRAQFSRRSRDRGRGGFKASGGIRTLADAKPSISISPTPSWARTGRRRPLSASVRVRCSRRSARSNLGHGRG